MKLAVTTEFTGSEQNAMMWDGWSEFPLRKNRVESDLHECEPTPHDEVLERGKKHLSQETTA